MASNKKTSIEVLQIAIVTLGITLGAAPLITGIFGEQKGLLRLFGIHLHRPYTIIIPVLVIVAAFGLLVWLDKFDKKAQ